MIEVVGGVYLETCLDPNWEMIFGSGGRAATFLATGGEAVTLHTYLPPEFAADIRALSVASGFGLESVTSTQAISFDYLHCLSSPLIYPPTATIKLNDYLEVSGDVVLRFGFMEGDAKVTGRRTVFDPQSPLNPVRFSANGSKAECLAIVGNEREIRTMGGNDNWAEAARILFSEESAAVIIVKRGPEGAEVIVEGREPEHVPAYAMDRIFSIGSGDIFSAAFTYYWALKEFPASEAADLASRSVANYCDSQSTIRLDPQSLREAVRTPIIPANKTKKVYLAGPFFNLPQRWLVEEVRNHLVDQGLEVFSPLHDVGFGGDPKVIAAKDLVALDSCDCVLALMDGADPGTIFEVGYAVSKKIPVVAFAQQLDGEPLTMLIGTDCEIARDFTTAIYRTAWVGRKG